MLCPKGHGLHRPSREIDVPESADISTTCSEIANKQPVAAMDFSQGEAEM